MKLLTATTQNQGVSGDYHYCVEGELVVAPVVICDRDLADPHGLGGCGCGRGWSGLNSHRATTTAIVSEVDITFDNYVMAIESSLSASGWTPTTQHATRLAAEMTELAAHYPIGTVLGHFLREPHIRAEPATA
jgi:hypothetical protein